MAYDALPAFFPDGRRFLYFHQGAETGLYVGTLGSSERIRLTDVPSVGRFVPPDWILYARNAALVAQRIAHDGRALTGEPITVINSVQTAPGGRAAFSVSDNGVLVYRTGVPVSPAELTWFDRQGGRLGRAGDAGYYTNPAISRDGRYLAVGRSERPADPRDIWVIDLIRGASSRFTFDAADDLNPVWSPDGSRIAFTSDRNGRRALYWKSVTGSSSEDLIFGGGGQTSLEDWSPDGRTLIFNVDTRLVASVPVAGDRKQAILLEAPFAQNQGQISPDGRWIAYASNENKRSDVFVQSYPPGSGKWQISINGGSEPKWRADGRELFFMSNSRVHAAEISAAGSRLEAGTPRELFEVRDLHGEMRRNRFVVTPDGKRFLVLTTPDRTDTTPLNVVVNWQAVLPE